MNHSDAHDEDDDGVYGLNVMESEIRVIDPDDEDGVEELDGEDEGMMAEDVDDAIYTFTGHTNLRDAESGHDGGLEAEGGEFADTDGEEEFDGEDEVYAVACSPTDGSLVATGGQDERGFLWKIGQPDWWIELQGHTDSVSSLAFSTDGQLLASGSVDGHVRIWDNAGGFRFALEGPGADIEWVRWHPTEHVVLTGSKDGTVWMWNADTSAYLHMFRHGKSVTCGDFTPDGQRICTGSDDRTLRIWNPTSGQNIHVVEGHGYHTEGLTCLSITSDSNLALTGSTDGSVYVVHIATGQVVSSLYRHSKPVECIGLATSFPWAATGGMDGKLVIWDLQHSSPRGICEHEMGVTCMSWLEGSRYLATGSVDGKVRIWDSLSGECVRIFSGHLRNIYAVAVSADGGYLVSASLDGNARVFDIGEFR